MKSYHDIVGDGGSRVVEQVVEQRARLERRLAGVRHLLAVGSGKGGVGKSTMTLMLASALVRQGRSCAILDADLNGPSQARLAGVRAVPFVPAPGGGLSMPRSEHGMGVVSLGGVLSESEALDFDSVSSGDAHTWRATREFTALGELMTSVSWGELDFLVVDLPPGAERTRHYAEFLGPRTTFVLVSLPSGLSRGVVSRSVAALRETPNRILGYVENMQGYFCAGCDEIRPLFPADPAVELDIPCLGGVPFDPELAAACDRGTPLRSAATDRPTVRAVDAIATRILRELEETR